MDSISTEEIELCMLCFNEEESLVHSLSSLSKAFSTFTFFDMGSTDRSKVIIADLLGGKAQVIHYDRAFLFQYGFAHARNFGHLFAKLPWLLWIDADEVLVSGIDEGRIRLCANEKNNHFLAATIERHNLALSPPAVYKVELSSTYNVISTEKHVRLCKNNFKVRWEGYIHEELRVEDENASICACHSSIRIDHLSLLKDARCTQQKSLMYSWMLMRAFDDPKLQTGINRYWFDTHVPNNREFLEARRREFSAMDIIPFSP
jgi:glycosyltransferase involved in cell wall biosynthesis